MLEGPWSKPKEPSPRLERSFAVPPDSTPHRGLAEGYAPSHRLYEYAGVVGAALCAGWLLLRLAKGPGLPFLSGVGAMVVGILIADFTSGFVHWLCDTWGSPSTPIVGKLAIRTFREHHVDEKAILRHDFVETNGHNCALSVVLSGWGLNAPSASPFFTCCLLAGAFFVAMTSQIHKWAHMDRAPLLVRALQRIRLILPPKHHDGHHAAPHVRNYCITAGWLDRPLHMLRFFETLEVLIRVVTGARPRGSRT